MSDLTPEQQGVVDAPMVPLCAMIAIVPRLVISGHVAQRRFGV